MWAYQHLIGTAIHVGGQGNSCLSVRAGNSSSPKSKACGNSIHTRRNGRASIHASTSWSAVRYHLRTQINRDCDCDCDLHRHSISTQTMRDMIPASMTAAPPQTQNHPDLFEHPTFPPWCAGSGPCTCPNNAASIVLFAALGEWGEQELPRAFRGSTRLCAAASSRRSATRHPGRLIVHGHAPRLSKPYVYTCI